MRPQAAIGTMQSRRKDGSSFIKFGMTTSLSVDLEPAAGLPHGVTRLSAEAVVG